MFPYENEPSATLPSFNDISGLPLDPGICGTSYPTFPTNVLNHFVNFSCKPNEYDALGFVKELGAMQAEYIADTESDLYSFNFGSYSGKFVINKDGSSVLFSPESGVIIKVINTNSWQATAPDGVIYKFTKKEYTRPYTFTSESANLEKVFGGTAGFDYISSWYLTDILLTNGENITFSYTDLNTESRNYGSIMVNKAEEISGHTLCNTDNQKIQSYNLMYTKSSSMNTIQCFLNKITWNEGYIDFSYLDRIDIETQVSVADKKLDHISINSLNGIEVSHIQFNYSYFNSQDSNDIYRFLSLRLKLDSIVAGEKKYGFNYLNPGSLPKKYSNSTDHWGYYNNEVNLSPQMQGNYQVPYYIPRLLVRDSYLSPTPKFYEGANRGCNPSVLTNGILTSIMYPTKGIVSFQYEPNDFEIAINSNTSYGLLNYNDAIEDASYSVNNPAIASLCQGCYVPSQNPTFTLTKKTSVQLEFRYSPYGSQNPSIPVDSNGNGLVFGSITRTDVAGYIKNYNFVPGTLGKVIKEEVILDAGTYQIKASNNYSFTTNVSAKFSTEKTLPTSKRITGGGVRIQKIISEKNTRQFNYTQENLLSKTSGLLMIEPQYGYTSYNLFHCFPAFIRESSPVHGLSDSGNTVGYSCVKESITDGINTSSTVSKYKNRIEFRSIGSNLPIMPAFENGLLEEEYYLNNARTVYKKKYVYENALVKRYELYDTYFLRINFAFGNYTNIAYYRIMPQWWKLKSEITQNFFYDSNGTQKIVDNIVDYIYNINNFKVNKTTTHNSKGQQIVQTITYPSDYSSSVYVDMKNRNINTQAVETIISVDSKVIKAKLSTYKEVQLAPVGEVQSRFVPEFEFEFKSTNAPSESSFIRYNGISANSSNYDEVLNFNLYNLRGEPLQITEHKSIKNTYLWGYNQNYPVAKIENATYSDVMALPGFNSPIATSLSDSQENILRTSLPSSIVTTYTYSPLIGITSMKDVKGISTYYEYDTELRLKSVKDNKGKLLTENIYHYKN